MLFWHSGSIYKNAGFRDSVSSLNTLGKKSLIFLSNTELRDAFRRKDFFLELSILVNREVYLERSTGQVNLCCCMAHFLTKYERSIQLKGL